MDLERVVAHFGAEAFEFHRVVNQVESRFIALQQRFASAAVGGGLLGGLVGAGTATAAVAAVAAIEAPIRLLEQGVRDVVSVTSQAIGTAVQLGMEWERASISFEVMTRSAETGRKVLGDLQQLAIETPYRAKQMTHYGEILLGYGVPGQDIVPTLARLGDIAGGNTLKFERLALAFGQVMSAGRFMGQEKRQFAEAGVGLEDFAKTAGMSGAQFRQAMEEGQIGADIVIKTINRLTNEGGRFFGLSSRVNLETVFGQWDSFMERLERTGRRLFASDPSIGSRGLFERFGVAGFIGNLGNQLDSLDQKINPFLDRLEAWIRRAGAGLSPLSNTFDILVGRVAKWIGAGVEGLPTWERVKELLDDFNKDTLPKFLDWVERTATAVKQLADQIGGAYRELKQMGEWIDAHTPSNVLPPPSPGTPNIAPAAPGFANDALRVADEFGKFTGLQGEAGREAFRRIQYAHDKAVRDALPAERAAEQSIRLQDAIRRAEATRQPIPGQVIHRWNPRTQTFDEIRPYDIHAVPQAAVGAVAGANAPLTMNDQKLAMALALGSARAGIPGTGAGAGWGEISPFRAGFNPTPEQHRVITELERYQPGEGLGDYGKFQSQMKLLIGLRYFVGTPKPEVGAVFGGMGGVEPQISADRFRRGVFDAYSALESKFGRETSVQLAPAAKLGSQEAMETVNRSLVELTSPLDKMNSILNEATLTVQALDKKIDMVIGPLLKEITGNVVQGKGF